jgi:hypothetical protein
VVVVLVRIRSKEKGTFIVSGRTLSAFFCDNSLVCNLSQVSAARYLNGQNKRTPAFKSLSYHIILVRKWPNVASSAFIRYS